MRVRVVPRPSAEEIARVRAWDREQERLAADRLALERRYYCMLHGPSRTRCLYGPMPWGSGVGCAECRAKWARQEGRPDWESYDRQRERERAEHRAMVRELEDMPPEVFYLEWERVRAERLETMRYGFHGVARDEFGVRQAGQATPEGRRYTAMRDRVRRELRDHEEARHVL